MQFKVIPRTLLILSRWWTMYELCKKFEKDGMEWRPSAPSPPEFLMCKLENALIDFEHSKTVKILSGLTKSKLWRKFWLRLDNGLRAPPPKIYKSFEIVKSLNTQRWWMALFFFWFLLRRFCVLHQLRGSCPLKYVLSKIWQIVYRNEAIGLHIVETDTWHAKAVWVAQLAKLSLWTRSKFYF